MKTDYEIILKPIITEKSMIQKDTSNSVAFKVRVDANKHEIKRAVEKIFDVTVLEVRTMMIEGKTKRMGRFSGQRANWKKAIVTLKPGDKIEYFEGAS
ncbi:50S ribosomal protein L23 [bacterium]|nr:50S ribosomal protein L23 [candidate division CSSED10-310 bacterium]